MSFVKPKLILQYLSVEILSIPLLCDIISLFEFILPVFPDMLQPSAVFFIFSYFVIIKIFVVIRSVIRLYIGINYSAHCIAILATTSANHHNSVCPPETIFVCYRSISTLIRCAICKTSPLFYHYRQCCPTMLMYNQECRPAIFHLCPLWYSLFLHLR